MIIRLYIIEIERGCEGMFIVLLDKDKGIYEVIGCMIIILNCYKGKIVF